MISCCLLLAGINWLSSSRDDSQFFRNGWDNSRQHGDLCIDRLLQKEGYRVRRLAFDWGWLNIRNQDNREVTEDLALALFERGLTGLDELISARVEPRLSKSTELEIQLFPRSLDKKLFYSGGNGVMDGTAKGIFAMFKAYWEKKGLGVCPELKSMTSSL